MKKIILNSIIAGLLSFSAAAQAEIITDSFSTTTALTKTGGASNLTFNLNISDMVNGFNAGVDILNSAFLTVRVTDDQGNDGIESFQIKAGTQTTDVNSFTSTLTTNMIFNAVSLSDLAADGSIGVAIKATEGDFVFNSAVLTADITRVPEPGSIALLGLGMVGLAAAGRKKKAA